TDRNGSSPSAPSCRVQLVDGHEVDIHRVSLALLTEACSDPGADLDLPVEPLVTGVDQGVETGGRAVELDQTVDEGHLRQTANRRVARHPVAVDRSDDGPASAVWLPSRRPPAFRAGGSGRA